MRDMKKTIFKAKTPATFIKTLIMLFGFYYLKRNVINPLDVADVALYESSVFNITPARLFFTVYLLADFIVFKLQ